MPAILVPRRKHSTSQSGESLRPILDLAPAEALESRAPEDQVA